MNSENPIVQINVFFRVFDEGDVIALWRNEDCLDSNLISSYQTIGQHSDAHEVLIEELRPATSEEKTKLWSELEKRGYKVVDADDLN